MTIDVYFTEGYGTSAAAMEGGSWQLRSWQDRVLVPLVVRKVDMQTADALSPYGYCGVHVAPGLSEVDLVRFWNSAVSDWRGQGIVTLFLRFSPLDLSSVRAMAGVDGVSLTRRGDTVVVATDRSPQELWSGLEGKSRNKVRRAERANLTASVRPVIAEDLAKGSPFRRLYEQTMTRVRAAPKYFFADRYYHALYAGIGDALRLAEARDADGVVVATALLMVHGDRMHLHLAGSSSEAMPLGCNNLLFWTYLRWAGEHGVRLVHLGGGVSAGDSLFRFKRTFGGRVGEFWTGQVIVDPDRYGVLVAQRAAVLNRPAETLHASGYFPAYRMGLS